MRFSNHTLTYFKGRNGMFRCSGVTACLGSIVNNEPSVIIEPITSKGTIGNCFIEIPQRDMKEFIDMLQKLVNENTKKDPVPTNIPVVPTTKACDWCEAVVSISSMHDVTTLGDWWTICTNCYNREESKKNK